METEQKYYYSTELEDRVIGMCLAYSEKIDDIAAFGIDETWFFSPRNRRYWKAISSLREKDIDVDAVSVVSELESQNKLNKDDPYNLASCVGEVGTHQFLDSWCNMLAEYVRLRRIDTLSSKMQSLCLNREYDSLGVLDFAKREYEGIETLSTGDNVKTLSDLYQQMVIDHAEGTKPEYVDIGLRGITEHVKLQTNQMTLLGGESSIGKTSLMCTVCVNANNTGTPVLFFSLEMAKEQLAERILSATSNVDSQSIRDQHIPIEKLMNLVEDRLSSSFFISDDSYNIGKIESMSRIYAKRYGVKLIVIDYLQLIETHWDCNREQEVNRIGQALKKLAKKCDAHVLAISSLDEAWGKPGYPKHPGKRNFRDSKSLHYHTDNAILLYTGKDFGPGEVGVNVAKARSYRTGFSRLKFIKDLTKFVDVGE